MYGKDEMKYEAQDTSAAPATKLECKAEDVSFPFSTCKLLMQQQLEPVIVTDYIEYGTENDEEANGGVYWKSLDIEVYWKSWWSAYIESLHYRHKVEEEKEKGKKRKERKAKEEGKRIPS